MSTITEQTIPLLDTYSQWDQESFTERKMTSQTWGHYKITLIVDKSSRMREFIESYNLGEFDQIQKDTKFIDAAGKKFYYAKFKLESTDIENPISRSEAYEFMQTIYTANILPLITIINGRFNGPIKGIKGNFLELHNGLLSFPKMQDQLSINDDLSVLFEKLICRELNIENQFVSKKMTISNCKTNIDRTLSERELLEDYSKYQKRIQDLESSTLAMMLNAFREQ